MGGKSLESEDVTPSSMHHSGNATAGDFNLPALYENMISAESFKKATGSVLPHTMNYNPKLETLYDAFFQSTRGSQKDKIAVFFLKLQPKYCLAIAEHYPLRMRTDPGQVHWVRSQADAEGFENWLSNHPGKVRFWVDEDDMYAEFLPNQA